MLTYRQDGEKSEVKSMQKHLTEKDIKEGEELMQILENLPEEGRKQVITYASALIDRQMIENLGKKAG